MKYGNIYVQNIYYMMTYAFRTLQNQGFRKIQAENFENIAELMAEILILGTNSLLKRGLLHNYIPKQETLSAPKGKLDISASVKSMTIRKRELVCSYEEYSVNAYMNRVLKTTIQILLKADIQPVRKKELRRIEMFFYEVEVLDPQQIRWNFQYHQNNRMYQLMMNICYFVIKGMLQTDHAGGYKITEYLDEQRMSHLYEKFLLEYYRQEHAKLRASASAITWDIEKKEGNLLPSMQSDVMLKKNGKTLIIDAKFYSHTTQERFGRHTLHSANVYQIYTYVKNEDKQNTGNVMGLLLYAETQEEIQPDEEYVIGGNKIMAKTLNLDNDFDAIREKLDNIAKMLE